MYLFNYWIQFDEDYNEIIISKYLFSYIFNSLFTSLYPDFKLIYNKNNL